MENTTGQHATLTLSVHDLALQVEEAIETLRAIRSGEVDALVVKDAAKEQVYTLKGADHIYRIFIENMSEGAVILDDNGTVLYTNRRFAELAQLPLEKVTSLSLCSVIAEEDQDAFGALFKGDPHNRHRKGEMGLRTGSGAWLRVLVSVNDIAIDGMTGCWAAIMTDVTELRQAQEDLQKANAELEARVEERTRALAQANAELAEVDERKDQFLATLAHELRNPLAPIQNAVEILHMRGVEDQTLLEQVRDIIERQLKQLVRLVNDLLDVSRFTRGKIELQKEQADTAVIVEQAVETSRPLIDERQHHLSIELPQEPIWLDADPARLSQVLSNLLNNAAKFTHDGGQIWLTIEREEGQVVIRVRDTGIGIPADMLPHVFDLFTQVNQTLEHAHGGVGIGLSLVRALVELHGGCVQAYSEGPGRGSEFVIRLPAAQQAEPPNKVEQESLTAGLATTSLRILVVDDNVDSADSTAMLLQMAGHEVRVAHDGLSAIQVAKEYRPRVAILDIGLPGIDGYEVARQLRHEFGNGSALLLIALSGFAQERDLRRSQEAGLDYHLAKPTDSNELLDIIAKFIV